MLSHLVLGAGLLTEAIRLFYHFGGLCAASSLTTLTMDHTSSSKEETSGLKVSSGSKTGPDWMCLDKRNRGGDLPLRAIQHSRVPSRQPRRNAAFELTSWNWKSFNSTPFFVSFIFSFANMVLQSFSRWEPVQECFLKPSLQWPDIHYPLLCAFLFYSVQSSFQCFNTIFVHAWQESDVTLANQCTTLCNLSQQKCCTFKKNKKREQKWTC